MKVGPIAVPVLVMVLMLGCEDRGVDHDPDSGTRATVFGRVTEAPYGYPLEGVEVWVAFDGYVWTAVTDQNGEYRQYFATSKASGLLTPCQADIFIEPVGYVPFHRTMVFLNRSGFRVDAELEKVN